MPTTSREQLTTAAPSIGFEGVCRLAGLATTSMLDAERRRPADGQRPAYQYWTGRAWCPLWTHADTVAKPALSPAQQARWDANRTCAQCRKRSARGPWSLAGNGRRYCNPDCERQGMQEWWDGQRAAERPALAAWARQVLDDGQVVLVAVGRDFNAPVRWRAETIGGLLFDVRVIGPRADPDVRAERLAEFPDAVDTAAAQTLLEQLRGRRILTWSTWGNIRDTCLNLTADGPDQPGLQDLSAVVEDPADAVGARYARWVGTPSGSILHADRCAEQPAPYDPVERIGRMRQVLAEMAAGELAGTTA